MIIISWAAIIKYNLGTQGSPYALSYLCTYYKEPLNFFA